MFSLLPASFAFLWLSSIKLVYFSQFSATYYAFLYYMAIYFYHTFRIFYFFWDLEFIRHQLLVLMAMSYFDLLISIKIILHFLRSLTTHLISWFRFNLFHLKIISVFSTKIVLSKLIVEYFLTLDTIGLHIHRFLIKKFLNIFI
jgi:hypothetical protein